MAAKAGAMGSMRRIGCVAVFALLVWMLVATASAEATPLPATITENTTLTTAASPYTGTSTIGSGVTVKVEPGVKFTINSLTVKGTLLAEGTAEAPIVFTGAKREKPGEWNHVKLEPGSGASVFNHTEFAYGSSGSGQAMLYVYDCSPTIENSTFSHSIQDGIFVNGGGGPEIANNLFLANEGRAIYFTDISSEGGKVNIHGNIVEGGTNGIEAVANNAATVTTTMGGNTVTGTTGVAFSFEGASIPGDITGNTLIRNRENLIRVKGTVAHTETWKNGGTKVLFTGEVSVASTATLTIEPGVYLMNPFMQVKGTLLAEGTAEAPIVFTGVNQAKPGEWSHVFLSPGSGVSVFNHTEFSYGSGASGQAMLYVSGASPTIENSTFSHSIQDGIFVNGGGGPEIANNHFSANEGRAIYFTDASSSGGKVNIHGNIVEGGTNGIEAVANNAATVTTTMGGNTVTGTTGVAFSFEGASIPGDITGNTLSGNSENIIKVKGAVSHSETWKNGGTKVLFAGEVTVASIATLTIEPGIYLMNPNMSVNGTILAEGTASEPIVFTGKNREKPGEWSHVKLSPGSGASVFNHTEFAYGSGGSGQAMLYVSGASPTIENSTFSHSIQDGIFVNAGGGPEIANNLFLANEGRAIYFTDISSAGGKVNIHGNTVEGGTNGILAVANNAATTTTTMGGNTVIGTSGVAFSYEGASIPGDITGNTLSGNALDAIQVSGTVAHSSSWKLGGAPVRFTKTVVVAAGATLTLQPGVYIQKPSMTVFGALRAEGSASRPVTLTGPGQEENGEWGGIYFESGSGSSLLNYTEVGFGGSNGPMLNVKGNSLTITNSTFRRSAGDAIRVQQSGQPIIEWNRFRDNNFGLRYEGEGKLHAPNNDWGCANGPKPKGCGDEVTSNVEWQPAAVLQELPRLCPGTTMLASSTTCLLQKYEPLLRYDSEENYYADSSAEITDNWGDETALWGGTEAGWYTNALIDESEWPYGTALGYSNPSLKGGSFPLTRSALGTTYPNGHLADEEDWLVENGEYVRDAHRLEAAGYLNAAYAHSYTDANGKRWLEYWYWYYYNPKDFAGVGKHEGDWETVIVGLDPNNRPEEVIFSQHDGAANCYIGEVEQTEEGGPVVYVGLDSHAGYEKPGVFWATGEDDWADGAGPSAQPGLTVIGESPPGWILWPGHWGNTKPEGGFPGQATSPQGPYFHEAWSAPDAYAAGAFECTKTTEEEGEPPLEFSTVAGASSPATIQSVTLVGRRPQISYKVPKAAGHGFWPRLRITVNELGDGGIPPVSRTISNVKKRGGLTIPIHLKPGHSAEVLGSLVYKNGRRIHLKPRIVRGR